MRYLLFFFFFFSPLQVFTHEYPYNPHVPIEVWTLLEPYFLPINHPIKIKVDKLFSKKRVTENLKTFEKGGFGKQHLRQPTNIFVGRHPDIPGYLFKVYLDSQPAVIEWDNWMKRIDGAKRIKRVCREHQFTNFIVPKKWIYPLPCLPNPAEKTLARKNFILIVEEIPILCQEENKKAYQTKITFHLLDQLFVILTRTGAIDSVYIDNIPFTREGKIAFIDTEHTLAGQIPYQKLTPYLNKKMKNYWEMLWQDNP